MIPMNAFVDADLSTFERIDTSPVASVSYKQKDETYPYTERTKTADVSAMLFSIEDTHYLFDADRRESRYGNLNMFVTKLPKKAKTIADAYEALKPKAVIDAEAKGLAVKRQGARWFIPSEAPQLPKFTTEEKLFILGAKASYEIEGQIVEFLTGVKCKGDKKADDLLKGVPKAIALNTNGRKQSFTTGVVVKGITYVQGEVSSDDRAKVTLDDWHTVVAGRSSVDSINVDDSEDDYE